MNLRKIPLTIAALALLAGCTTDNTTSVGSLTGTVTTDITNVLDTITGTLPANDQAVVATFDADAIKVCSFLPDLQTAEKFISLFDVTAAGAIASGVGVGVNAAATALCNTLNASKASLRRGGRRFGSSSILAVYKGIPIKGKFVSAAKRREVMAQ